MAENSETSVQTDKPRTKKTSAVTPEQALQILQQSVINCQQAGIKARIMPIYDAGERLVAIMLPGVEIVDDFFVVASTGTEAK